MEFSPDRFRGRVQTLNFNTMETISNFEFTFNGHGHYKVTYTSPKTGRKWYTVTNNMPLIDDTKNAEYPKQKDLKSLKQLCKGG